LFETSKQPSLQQVSLPVQCCPVMPHMHAPFVQLSPGLHCVSQFPQAEVAVMVLTQLSLQQLSPAMHFSPEVLPH
jgi:hypothetical protein